MSNAINAIQKVIPVVLEKKSVLCSYCLNSTNLKPYWYQIESKACYILKAITFYIKKNTYVSWFESVLFSM